MNILIVDDLEQDRKILRRTIQKKNPEHKISEASNLGRMYAELAKPCDLLFLDISLNGNESPDSEGLNAIYDLKEGYPGLPVCLITGFFKEKIYEFLGDFMTETGQIVDCLDKGNYKIDNLLKVYSKAENYRIEFQEKVQESRAAEDLLEEALEAEIKKLEERTVSDVEDLRNRMNLLATKEKAYEGEDWVARIETEKEIRCGSCQINALLLCVEIDRLSQSLCERDFQDCGRFYPRSVYLSEKHSLKPTTKGMLNKAWSIRNLVVHGQKTASYQDTLTLLNAFELLQRLEE